MNTAKDKLLLDVQNLTTRFHIAEGTIYAVNGVSFNLHECETLAVVGESGCGKSVTMMSMIRLLPMPPAQILEGSKVLFRGRDLVQISENELERIRGHEIAMIFQDPMTALNPVLTIGRQLSEPLRVHLNLDQEAARQRAIDLLTQVGISDAPRHLNDYPHQFSGGMRQRVMIAMALACAPSLLIADEPTTALDVTIQAQIVELVKRLRDELCMAVIWITHDLGVVAGIADRVNVMYSGFIVEEATVDELYENPQHPYTLALLGALPRVDRRRGGSRLKSIPGAPPNLLIAPHGCPFAPRCEYVFERCTENPPLMPVGVNHRSACWYDLTNGRPR